MQSSQFDGVLKVCNHFEWLKRCLKDKIPRAISMEIDITNNCNYNCPNCTWEDHNKNHSQMTPELVMRVVNECANAGLKAIVFSGGGEPLVNPAFKDAVVLARKRGLSIGLFTNGIFLKDELADVVIENCDWARINLGGVSEDIYTFYHGVDGRQIGILRENLTAINDKIKDSGSKIIVGIGTTVNETNINDIKNIVEFARQTGCRYFQAKHDFELLSKKEYDAWWKAVVMPLMIGLKDEYSDKTFNIDFTVTDYTSGPMADKCYIHYLASAINADGEVVFCKRLRDKPEWSIGNIEDKTLSELFESEKNILLSEKITPQNCGIICPYLVLNDFIGSSLKTTHPDFF